MSIHVNLNLCTRYGYDRPVMLSPHLIRLRPALRGALSMLSTRAYWPSTHFINWQQDPFSNYVARLVFHEKTTSSRSRSLTPT
jgi:hypothetical protein